MIFNNTSFIHFDILFLNLLKIILMEKATITYKDFSGFLFWDIDKQKIDFELNAPQIVERVLLRGAWEDFQLLLNYYGRKKVGEISKGLRYLDTRTMHFCCVFFDIPLNDMGLLKNMMEKEYLNPFFLVGVTALALHLGKRKSDDLDLFSTEDFDPEVLLENLKTNYTIVERSKTKGRLITEINGIKTDFIRFKYPLIRPFVVAENIRYLALDDIAPMKLDAITGRGTKKDFYDIFFLLKHFTLDEMLNLYDKMYSHSTIFHVIKSLTYFDDAETQTDPIIYDTSVTWEVVKKEISKAVGTIS
jgi:hypothetical protein